MLKFSDPPLVRERSIRVKTKGVRSSPARESKPPKKYRGAAAVVRRAATSTGKKGGGTLWRLSSTQQQAKLEVPKPGSGPNTKQPATENKAAATSKHAAENVNRGRRGLSMRVVGLKLWRNKDKSNAQNPPKPNHTAIVPNQRQP